METIAVYWEEKIKTYGFQELLNLSLFECDYGSDVGDKCGELLSILSGLGISFHLVLFEEFKDHAPRLYVILDKKWENLIKDQVDKHFKHSMQSYYAVTSPVGMIYFHGPHYGDRYGIAETVFTAMAERAIPVLAACLSGSAVYLVLEEQIIQEARKALGDVFVVPQGNRGRPSP